MTNGNLPSVGAKDMQDLKGVSRFPAIALLQRYTVPSAPRPKDSNASGLTISAGLHPPPHAAENARQAVFRALKQFAPGDYVKWLFKYFACRLGPRHPFLTYEGTQSADGIYPLESDGDDLRICVAGDWGTGTDEAHRIAGLIGEAKPQYTIHLGDVYFFGDASEVRENFLGLRRDGNGYTPCQWPLGSKGSFALNGNHEMYARGVGYFDEILPAMGPVLNGKAQGQLASFFCLKNNNWCILGLDTGYNSVGMPLVEYVWSPDATLPCEIVKWLEKITPQIENQAVIILTHHQVLSVFDACFTKQADQIFEIFKRPVLWLWGHEHRLVVYEPFDGSGRKWPMITGRCVGHGGMPVDLPGVRKVGSIGTASFVDKRIYQNDEKLHISVNGFVQLDFKDDLLRIDYIDVFGQVVYKESFRAEAGAAVMQVSENFSLSVL